MEVNSILTGKKGVSLPFTDYCEPIIDGNISFFDIFNQLIDLGKNWDWKRIELRGGQKFLSDTSFSPSSFPFCSPAPAYFFYLHTVDLTKGERELNLGLRESTRRNIKKAQNSGVTVEFSKAWRAMESFCRLNSLTRKRHGLPPQPKKFFKNFFEDVIAMGEGIIALASYRGKVIAANIFILFGKKAIYKYGASDLNFQNLRANNLLMWESIKWLLENQYESLSLGRTELKNQGLRQFKNGWGAEESSISYYSYDLKKGDFIPPNHDLANWQKWIFSKLPIPILNYFGSLLYRHAA